MKRKNTASKETVFVNFSNHPSDRWSEDQMEASRCYGRVVDVPFPMVDPGSTEADIRDLASEYADRIAGFSPSAVMCQGEFTLCFAVINKLKAKGITVLAACSRRMVKETAEGKMVCFNFAGFREY